MRLPVYPGRGGRGHPTLPTPKYLIEHKAIYTSRMEMLKKNRFSLLDQPDECFESDEKNHESKSTNGDFDLNINRLWAPLIKGGHKPPTVHCHSVY